MANGSNESTVTVKWWPVLAAIVTIAGTIFTVLFGYTLNHEGRLTRMETQYSEIRTVLGELKDTTKEIRQEQIKSLRGR